MTDEPFNAAERSDVKAAATAARLAEREAEDVVRAIMRTTAGRAWMHRKLAFCNVHQTTFTGDALRSAFMEGARNVGLMLEAEIIRTCPDDFILMLREANERNITDDITRRNRRNGAAAADDSADRYVDYGAAFPAEPADGQVERED